MPDLSRRADEPELLDLGVAEAEALRSLADLRFVNRRLGGGRSLLAGLRPILAEASRPRLLDVGCGSADLPALLQLRFPELRAVGVDLKPLHLRLAPAGVARVVADVRALPFAPGAFDVVTTSLFLHHFDSEAAAAVLRELFGLARRALVVNDLHRARVPYWFGRCLFPLLFRSPVSVVDGLISIRRGFTPGELAEIFGRAGIPGVEISRVFPYRLLAVARR